MIASRTGTFILAMLCSIAPVSGAESVAVPLQQSKAASEPAHACSQTSLEFRPQSLQRKIRETFDAGRFEALDQQLTRLHNDLDRTYCSDRPFLRVFASLSDGAVSEEPRFNAWIARKPASAFAYTARGQHFLQRASYARGDDLAKKTAYTRFGTMQHFLDLAESDYAKALDLDPGFSEAMAGTINARMLGPSSQGLVEAYKRFVDVAPRSYSLDSSMLAALKPRWHGSVKMMRQLAAQEAKGATANPDMVLLPSLAECLVAEDAADIDDSTDAKRYYDLGTEWANKTDPYCDYASGLIFRDADNYVDAANAFDKYLSIEGPVHNASMAADVLWRHRRFKEAVALYSSAIFFHRQSPELFCGRAESQIGLGKWRQAKSDVEVGLSADPDKPSCVRLAKQIRDHGT